MDFKPPINNDYLFGNIILEAIPHPDNFLGTIIDYLSVVCHIAGGIPFWVGVLTISYLFFNRLFCIKIALALFSTGIINGLLKYFFESPRPSGLSSKFASVQENVTETSFGLPSGHSHVSILVWGIVFLDAKQKWVKAIALFFILFTPFSRMYSGVHYPGDVLGGFLCGVSTLIFIQWFFKKYPEFPNPSGWENPKLMVKLSIQIIVLLTISFILMTPPSPVHESSLISVVAGGASLAGFYSGFVVLKYYFPNYSREKVGSINPILSISLLVIGILFLYIVLGQVSKTYLNNNVVFRYFRYFLLNFYIVFFIPFLTIKFTSKKNA